MSERSASQHVETLVIGGGQAEFTGARADFRLGEAGIAQRRDDGKLCRRLPAGTHRIVFMVKKK